MGFDALAKLKEVEQAAKKAGHVAEEFINKKKEERKAHHEAKEAAKEAERKRAALKAELERKRRERQELLDLIKGKLAGKGTEEMPELTCFVRFERNHAEKTDSSEDNHKAVFLVTMPIHFGNFELTKTSYKLLARHVGMTLDGVSHWALCVIDRGLGPCYCYDLMSDQMALNAIGKNRFRVNEIKPEEIKNWNACYYVGETTKSHEVIEELGRNHMTLHPRYNLMSNNCQDLVENLVKLLCEGKTISQAKLSQELSHLSPKIAMDMMVARLRTKTDHWHENEESETVKEDVNIIKELWAKVRR